MWSIETTASRDAAQSITGISPGWSTSGRLGLELTTGDHPVALAAVRALRAAGHTAWIGTAPGTRQAEARAQAIAGLSRYRQARSEIVEDIHAALAVGVTKSAICRESGLSRSGLDGIITTHLADVL